METVMECEEENCVLDTGEDILTNEKDETVNKQEGKIDLEVDFEEKTTIVLFQELIPYEVWVETEQWRSFEENIFDCKDWSKIDKLGLRQCSMECFYYFLSFAIVDKVIENIEAGCLCEGEGKCELCGEKIKLERGKGIIEEEKMVKAILEIDLNQLLSNVETKVKSIDTDFVSHFINVFLQSREHLALMIYGIYPYMRIWFNKKKRCQELTNRVRTAAESSSQRNQSNENGENCYDRFKHGEGNLYDAYDQSLPAVNA